MISAVLLAAGLSRRMGVSKALLSTQGELWIERALRHLAEAQGIDEIVCVTGHEHERVSQWIGDRARVVHNPRYNYGIMTSIQQGVRHVDPRSDAALITFVDLPLLESLDHDRLISLYRGGSYTLGRYLHRGVPAHPVLIGRTHFDEIRQQPAADFGCSFLFRRHREHALWLEAGHARGTRDVDTPEELHAYLTT